MNKRKLKFEECKKIFNGTNSQGYLQQKGASHYFIKYMNKENQNWLDRFEREIRSIEFLKKKGIGNIPNIVDYDKDEGYIVMNYIEGQRVNKICDNLLKRVAEETWFIGRRDEGDAKIKNASDSLILPNKFMNDTKQRFKSLSDEIKSTFIDDGQIKELIDMFLEDLSTIKSNNKRNKEAKLDISCQIFSQSDVGIHNILVREEEVYFVDFEHSGWDDPAKIICDWICRYENMLTINQSKNICNLLINKFRDRNLRDRVVDNIDIVNLKWQAIRLKNIQKKYNKYSEEIQQLAAEIRETYEKKKRDLEKLKEQLVCSEEW